MEQAVVRVKIPAPCINVGKDRDNELGGHSYASQKCQTRIIHFLYENGKIKIFY